ncbi:MAG: tetratricopeptide repeat protein [Pseudomonadota bacterium]
MTRNKTAYIKALRTNLKHALRQGDLAQAADIVGRLKEEEPLSVHTRGLELEYLIAAGQWTLATPMVAQLLEMFPNSARLHYLAARVYYHDKVYRQALVHFQESERIHSHWLTRQWLGKTYTQLGQFSQAEALLVGLLSEHPWVNMDLAWLYERSQQPGRALKYVEDYLSLSPDDAFAQAQCQRLRAASLGPQALMSEVDSLLEFDEPIPEGMLPVYVQRLLETGQGAQARHFIYQYSSLWQAQQAASMAWVCHRFQAYDLALHLFLIGLPDNTGNYKYLSALESAAQHCKRVDELIRSYEELAPQDKRLYGRIKSLNKRIAGRE